MAQEVPVTIAGRYEILGRIAEGGMGSLYKVRHRLLEVIRVAKVMKPQLAQEREWQKRFLREAKTASKLRHSSIAQLHDFDIDPVGGAWMIMEFIDGCTLQDVLQHSGPPSVGAVLEIARQTAAALDYIHAQGLVHRDVSPDNLMLTRAPHAGLEVKLIDLGIAKRIGDEGSLTTAGSFLGKYRYSSPEQLDAVEEVGPRSDLYSFGLVVYELLTGVFPLKGATASELAAAHWFQAPTAFSESDPQGRIPEEARDAILKCVEKKEKDRFATAGEFAASLPDLRIPRADLDEELGRILTATASARPAIEEHPSSGSTQDHLDLVFGSEGTPAPGGREAEKVQKRSQALSLAATAEGEMAVSAWNSAAENLRQAQRLDPENQDVIRQLQEAETQLQRQARVRAAVERVESLLASGQLDEAARRLTDATTKIGDSPELSNLLSSIERKVKARASKVGSLLNQARRSGDAGQSGQALEFVSKALQLDPESRAGQQLKIEYGRTEEARESIVGLLAGDRIDEARAAFQEIVAEFGEMPALKPAKQKLDRRLAEREAKINQLLERSHRLLGEDRLEEGLETAGAATSLDPNHTQAARTTRELETALESRRRLRRSAEAVHRYLDREELDEAKAALDLAVAAHGTHPALEELASRLASLRAAQRERHSHELMTEAKELVAASEWAAADKLYRQVTTVDPDHSGAQRGLRSTSAELAKQHRVTEATARINKLLEARRFDEAGQRLDEAIGVLGGSAELETLQAKVARISEHQQRVQGHLDESERRREQKQYREAIEELHKARELHPELEVGDRFAELRKLEVRAAALKRATKRALKQVERGDLTGVQRLLVEIEATHGKDPALDTVRQRLAAAKQKLRQSRIGECLDEAAKWKQAGHLKEALRTIREAAELDPSHQTAADLLHQIEGEIREREKSRAQVADKLETLEHGLEEQEIEHVPAGRRRRPGLSPRRVVGFAAVLGVAVAAVLGWRLLFWSSELVVSPDPPVAGLAISIAGDDSGVRTPGAVRLQGRRGAEVEIGLERQGAVVATRTFLLGPDVPTGWSPRIAVNRSIVTRPPGARVALDGTWLEETTPIEVSLDPDPQTPHELRLELADHEPLETSVRLSEWADTLELELTVLAKPGTLVVEAPYAVDVTAGGRSSRGRSARIELPAGTHEVSLSARSVFYSKKTQVRIAAGEESRVTTFPAIVSVLVLAVPGNADLLVDGRRAASLPQQIRLVSGRHRFEFRWPQESYSSIVEITGATHQISSDGTQIQVD